MCGFSIVRKDFNYNINILKHRGIDHFYDRVLDYDINFFSLPLSSFKSGITQPIKTKKYTMLFNGEIFNFKDFSDKYSSDLHYLSHLLDLYDPIQIYKESIKWDGFWAIALIDNNGHIFTFTDPLGKKQLYFNKNGICSEIKPILQDNYQYREYIEKDFNTVKTNFIGTYRFLPGILYEYSLIRTGIQVKKIFDIDYLKINYPIKFNDDNLYEIIDQSVKNRLLNKIDGVTLFISGGLDSNIILHHVLKYCKDVELLTIENDEGDLDFIQQFHGVKIKKISNEISDIELEKVVSSYEYSLDYGSLIPNYLLFKASKNHVVLSGDGSDELFSGYSRALINDTWNYDVLSELPFYHNVRLDRMSMMFTKEIRCPLMSLPLFRYSKQIPYEKRKNKQILRDIYKDKIPKQSILSQKKPLRYKGDKDENIKKINSIHKQIFKTT